MQWSLGLWWWSSARGAVSRKVKYTEMVISLLKFCCWTEAAAALRPLKYVGSLGTLNIQNYQLGVERMGLCQLV